MKSIAEARLSVGARQHIEDIDQDIRELQEKRERQSLKAFFPYVKPEHIQNEE